MKKVFSSNAEVAHVWAQQKQSEGRSGSMFFECATIFSYGHHFPMASFVKTKTGKTVVMVTTRRYSVTTSLHQSIVASSIPGFTPVIYVTNLFGEEIANVKDMLFNLNETRATLTRARKNAEWHTRTITELTANLKKYIEEFKIKLPADLRKNAQEFLSGNYLTPEAIAKIKKNEASAREQAKKQRIERERKNAENLEKWLKGEDVRFFHDGPAFLRVQGEDVQTSKGARIPLGVAERVWKRITSGAVLDGMNLGYYTVNTWDGDVLTVGCHQIKRSEMQRLANVLGW